MSVTIVLPSMLARLASDQGELEARGATVGDAVTDVIARFPALGPRLRDEAGEPYPFVSFYLNDEDIRLRGGFQAPVRDGDEVIVVPTVAGG
ncbi:MAG TPA: MoaD/ThiS family protein [Gemmatimonadaceae bacterium]|nr:MoaD/ThiS family protein [Gemmatimonadaceae bacterium]